MTNETTDAILAFLHEIDAWLDKPGPNGEGDRAAALAATVADVTASADGDGDTRGGHEAALAVAEAVADAKREYAAALAPASVLTEAELTERFSLLELHERYHEHTTASIADLGADGSVRRGGCPRVRRGFRAPGVQCPPRAG
jgi:hypothetical protein